MCVTTDFASLTETVIGAWEIEHPKHGYRHVLAYQNSPQNLSPMPNCMLLHIPAAKDILPEHIIDTSAEQDRHFLKEVAGQIKNQGSRGVGLEYGAASRGMDSVNYVTQMGIYHIAILNYPKSYGQALAGIPADKRPNIPQEFIDFYTENYDRYRLVLCCFNNRDAAEASPIMLHYAPLYPGTLMLPIIEGHGDLPLLGTPINGERIVMFGSHKMDGNNRNVFFMQSRGCSPGVAEFLPRFVIGKHIKNNMFNMDLFYHCNDLTHPLAGDIAPSWYMPMTDYLRRNTVESYRGNEAIIDDIPIMDFQDIPPKTSSSKDISDDIPIVNIPPHPDKPV